MVVRADLPGIRKEDIRLHVGDGMLTLEGERKQEHEEKKGGIYRSERSYGRFCRTIPLPEGIDEQNVQASFKDGVLEVNLPLPQQRTQQGREVQIK